jgi:CDP-diacylglycerol---glycerol-3-phosphate 3-phosphatidyltransferase
MSKLPLNLPNSLTIARILGIPFCLYALFKDSGHTSSWQIGAWCGFFLIGLTDLLDGRLARARGSITDFGIFLDPVADKAAIGSAMVGLSLQGRLWWWVTILIMFREIAVTTLRLTVLRHGVIPASRGGKIKTLFQGFGVGFYILPLPHYLQIPRDIFMTIAILLTMTTGIDYFLGARRWISEQSTKGHAS